MKLAIIHNSIDLTLKMDNFTSPIKELDLTQEIYIGYYKPIRNIYIEMIERDDDATITLEAFSGGSYKPVKGLEDKTFGLTKSGMILWDETESDESTYDDLEAHWYKLTLSTPATVSINGINLVLSNDLDLSFVPNLAFHLSDNATSFIAFHQEARNQIVQRIRNSGVKISGYDSLIPKEVDTFDLLNIDEFKQASKYLALNLIYEDLSKSDDDQYASKAARYFEKYEMSLNERLSSVDLNNNGIKDEFEALAPQFIRIKRE